MITESENGYVVELEGMERRGYFRTLDEAELVQHMLANDLQMQVVSIDGTAVPQPDYEPGYPGGVIAWQYDYPPGPPARRTVVTHRGVIVARIIGLPVECATGRIDRDAFNALPVVDSVADLHGTALSRFGSGGALRLPPPHFRKSSL